MSTRLNKLLSTRGIGARRKCDTIIAEGRVRVNGRVVSEPGTMVEEQRDRVEVDGRPLPKAQQHSYFVINKPVGVITTLDDPQGRRTIAEFLPRGQRLYPVGRLDADTSGLLLLTNDGDLAHKLMHPRYGVEKFYRVRLDREPGARQLERLAQGVEFERGVVSAPARVRRIDPGFDAIMIEVAIHEGRYRQVRRMCEAVGLTVTGLHRVGYGPIRLGPLARGMWRELSDAEVEKLRASAARPLRRAGAPGRPERPARSARPTRSAPPPAARRAPAPPDETEVEDTWIPGGGFAPEREASGEGGEPGEWPARAGRRRGDEDFAAGGEGPPSREARLPWHAPEYRRGTASRSVRTERAPRGEGRPPRRDERGPRAEARPPRRDPRAPRAESRPGRGPFRGGRDERGPRAEARPLRGDRPGPRSEGRPPRRDERGPRAGAGPGGPFRGRRDERGPRAGAGPGGPFRGRRADARGPAAAEDRGRARPRNERGAGPRKPRPERSGPPRRGDARAVSPRPGRGPGPERSRDRRGPPQRPSGERRGGQARAQGRPRNR